MRGVVFPPKEFMIEKYSLVSSSELLISSQNSVLKTQNWKLKYWWLWYPYRWWVALRAIFSGKR